MVPVDISECTESSDNQDSEQLTPSWTSCDLIPESPATALDFLNLTCQIYALVNLQNWVCPVFQRNHILHHLSTNTSIKTSGSNFLVGLTQKKSVTKDVHLQITEGEQKYTQVLLATSALTQAVGIHPLHIVQPTTLGLYGDFCVPNIGFPSSAFSRKKKKSFTAINQLDCYWCLGWSYTNTRKSWKRGFKWITLDIFMLLTFLCCVLLFRVVS